MNTETTEKTSWGAEVIAKTETALFTREKMSCGTPRRMKWAYVVRLGLASINGGSPVYAGGCCIFSGKGRAARSKAEDCWKRNTG